MLFWELEPNFIAVNICLSIYFDFHLMLLNGGRDQFEVAKVLHFLRDLFFVHITADQRKGKVIAHDYL